MAAITQLMPWAGPGRRYGLFDRVATIIRELVEELALRTVVSGDDIVLVVPYPNVVEHLAFRTMIGDDEVADTVTEREVVEELDFTTIVSHPIDIYTDAP